MERLKRNADISMRGMIHQKLLYAILFPILKRRAPFFYRHQMEMTNAIETVWN